MIQIRARAFSALSVLVLSAVALSGCESVQRYAQGRQKMTETASQLQVGTTYADSYALTRAIQILKDYSDALDETTQMSGDILNHLDQANVDQRHELGQLFNLSDWGKLEIEMLRVSGAENGIADQCESDRFRELEACDQYRHDLKDPLSRNRETLTFRYAQILKRI